MEQFDREKAQRVWKRVQGEILPPLSLHNPAGLLLEELTDIRMLNLLLRQSKDRSLLSLYQSRAAVLRGLCRLADQQPPADLPEPRIDNPATVLRRLMGRLLRRLQEYRQLSDHGEYGPLYEGLAQEAQASALRLAAMIGK